MKGAAFPSWIEKKCLDREANFNALSQTGGNKSFTLQSTELSWEAITPPGAPPGLMQRMNGGKGTVRYRRALRPEVFHTNWSYVDHAVAPPGASIGRRRHEGVEEFYYVMAGEGVVSIGKEQAVIKAGEAVPVFLNEVHGMENQAAADWELMIAGVARTKWALDTTDVP